MRLRHTHQLSEAVRDRLHVFLHEAFDGDFADTDFDHCLGGVHVTAEDDTGLLGHAAVVQRQLIAGGTVLRTGYVEAVAVATSVRRRGVGDAVMELVDDVIRSSYDLGALSASEVGRSLYLRRGWLPWAGPLGVVTVDGVRATPADQGSTLVLRTGRTAAVGLSGRLLCDWRSGSPW